MTARPFDDSTVTFDNSMVQFDGCLLVNFDDSTVAFDEPLIDFDGCDNRVAVPTTPAVQHGGTNLGFRGPRERSLGEQALREDDEILLLL